jgi:anti-sigma factor RsiW
MKCGQIQRMLPACLDGILSKTETALVEKHLAACDSCRASFEEYQQARQRLKKLEEVEPPPGFAQKIMARIEQEEGKKGGLLRKLFYPLHIKVPIQAVATVVIALLAIQTYRSVEPQKQTAPPDAITAVPGPKEEPARKEDRQQEAALPAKKTLPTSEETAKAPASAAAPREAERAEVAAGGKKAKMEAKTAVSAPPPEAASLQKGAGVGVALRVAEVASTGEKVQTILQEMGGSRIERTRLGEDEIVTADLNPQRLPEFLDRLKALGEMPEKPRVSKPTVPSVSVRIEIFKK